MTNAELARQYLTALQDTICEGLEAEDGAARFSREESVDERGSVARPRVLDGGDVIERAAVHYTNSRGDSLPPAATARKPELAGRPFEAVSLSLIVHPRNPYAPTSHMNVRYFVAGGDDAEPVWWFGGGFDLTPFYGFEEDAVHWHRQAREACEPFGDELYPRYKEQCDAYFFLKHRGETRGVGGLFFDDLGELGPGRGFDETFAFWKSVGDHYLPAYRPILARRKGMPYGEREREHQLWRRGRYVEFNLIYDRGTLYGLQSGRRVESVLASMPPRVQWRYAHEPEPGSDEARLVTDFLVPRDWLAE